MTTATYHHPDDLDTMLKQESMYPVDTSNPKVSLLKQFNKKEADIITALEKQGFVITSIKSELISSRRYKRRRAKELMRMSKKLL